MPTPKEWRSIESTDDWMRAQEKRIMHEERRPRITQASDLLGPGFASFAVEIADWNVESATYNGFFYSPPGAANAPEALSSFLGLSIMSAAGHGQQIVWAHREGSPIVQYARARHSHSSQIAEWTAWETM